MKRVTYKYVDQRFEDLRLLIDQRFKDSNDNTKVALEASTKAVDKAEGQGEKWRENANEWRGAMSDREKNLLSRKEFYTMIGTATSITALALTIWALTR